MPVPDRLQAGSASVAQAPLMDMVDSSSTHAHLISNSDHACAKCEFYPNFGLGLEKTAFCCLGDFIYVLNNNIRNRLLNETVSEVV